MQTSRETIEVAGFDAPIRANEVFRSEFYSRHVFRLPHTRARGHIFQISRSPPLALLVSVDAAALSLDFSKYSARPGLPGRSYMGRPGIYLSRLVRDTANASGFCLGLNGNNLGYWPNQFAIVQGELIFKPVPGLYEQALEDVSGPAYFLAQSGDGSFEIRPFQMVSTVRNGSRSVVPPGGIGFATGISGYPLLVRSCPVWVESRRDAWDPKLIVGVPLAHAKTRAELVDTVASAALTGHQLPKHAFTLAGTTAQRSLILVAVEEWEDSEGGIGLASAADLMACLGCTDAIVLGGKGDVQAVSSQEGPIVRPLLSPHDLAAARPVHAFGMRPEPDLINHKGLVLERPIPCAVVLSPMRPG